MWKLWQWTNEFIAMITGIAVAGVLLERVIPDWWAWVLFFIIAAGIAAVVDNACNGNARLALSLEKVLGEIQSKIEGLEDSVKEIDAQIARALKERQ